MNGAGSSANDTITQLNAARNLALVDAAYYPQIVPGVVPIIGANASLDLRRWGADFLAETFASPTLAGEEKQKLSLVVLQTLKDFLENPSEDTGVVKSVVQAAASIYPLVVRHTITNPTDGATWQKMASIKSSILRRMDTAPAGVRICCIKFVQKVVQTQTPGLITDPRRTEQNEISLALVPRDHPLIPPSNLEAEASGLLDRLLGVLQENESDALIITATLNSLGVLVRTRASIANKIVSTVLNFNPFKQANSPMTPKTKVMVKSTARTTRAFLMNMLKKNPNHPMAGRIQGYIERLHQSLVDMFDESSRKRAAPSEPTDGLDSAKRQRLGADVLGMVPGRPDFPALPQGPVSYAQLFTLTTDEGSKNFDVQAIPIELVVQILVPILAQIGVTKLNDAINAVRARYLSLGKTSPTTALDAAKLVIGAPLQGDDDEDDDYEPDYPIEDAEQIVNKLNNAPPDDVPPERPPEIALGPFRIPQPPPLTEEETEEHSKGTVRRVFGMVSALDGTTAAKSAVTGLNRLAASNYDRDAWVTMICRLATRASAGLENGKVKSEGESNQGLFRHAFSMGDSIRDTLYMYVIEDFRRRIDIAISWLNEEWYNDQIQLKQDENSVQHYQRWVLKVLDGIVPYLDVKDKVLIRFLSEIPGMNVDILTRVKKLARDPERVTLAIQSIQYLLLMRPPVREICIDALEDLWRNYDDAKAPSAKLLTKYRPHVLQEATTNGSTEDMKTE